MMMTITRVLLKKLSGIIVLNIFFTHHSNLFFVFGNRLRLEDTVKEVGFKQGSAAPQKLAVRGRALECERPGTGWT